MESIEFFGLQRTDHDNVWSLPVEQRVATGGQFLFGGCGLGAAVDLLGHLTGRPVVWATAQFLSFARIGEVVDIVGTVVSSGRFTSQARAVAKVGDREILTVNGAFGERPAPWSRQWPVIPAAPEPADCPQRTPRWPVAGSITEIMEIRIARGRQWPDLDGVATRDGRSLLWARVADLGVSPALLCILGDYVPYGIAQALGLGTIMSNSLDNTVRIHSLAPTEWVLIDISIDSVAAGFGHGEVRMWAQDGTLLGVATQTAIIRELKE